MFIINTFILFYYKKKSIKNYFYFILVKCCFFESEATGVPSEAKKEAASFRDEPKGSCFLAPFKRQQKSSFLRFAGKQAMGRIASL